MSLPTDPVGRHRAVARVFTDRVRVEQILRGSGQYGPAVAVPDGSPVQDRLVGFIGRDPAWATPAA